MKTGYYICTGLGATGSGHKPVEAWDTWHIEMILKGKGKIVEALTEK